jgi:uncharacterized paraquat-inducible protein A
MALVGLMLSKYKKEMENRESETSFHHASDCSSNCGSCRVCVSCCYSNTAASISTAWPTVLVVLAVLLPIARTFLPVGGFLSGF